MQNDDYQRIEQAIRFLDARFREQPSLSEIAAHVGLSEHHFERLFTRWAGITPKRFVQYLTAEYARTRLQDSKPLLEVAYDSGLSGNGRLHDLFINVYAMSPGTLRNPGQDLTIAFGVHETPFGDCLLGVTEKGICSLHFMADESETPLQILEREWPGAVFQHAWEVTASYAGRIFEPLGDSEVPKQPLGLLVKGTNFQIRVWEALLRIPTGHLVTYEDIASEIGAPKAVRAVGSAIARNPIGWLIPCHRVIRKSGAFNQYRWGLERKKAMLAWEAAASERLIAPEKELV